MANAPIFPFDPLSSSCTLADVQETLLVHGVPDGPKCPIAERTLIYNPDSQLS